MSVSTTHNQLEASFYPFTLTKPFAALQIGRYSFKERWKLILQNCATTDVEIPMHFLPTIKLIQYIEKNKTLPKQWKSYCIALKNCVDITKNTNAIIEIDIALAQQKKRKYTPLASNVSHTGMHGVYIEEGANIYTSFFNTENGPIYISKNAIVQEGVCLRGPIYIGENTIVKMGTTIYGGTIIGNHCLIGGEVKNAIVMHNSNKAHYGYLGDSIIGEWCNLGAGTSNSNIKNNVGAITLQLEQGQLNAGIKYGLLMGHYSRSAINTAFNTGTVVGIGCNIFAQGLTPQSIASFSWGVMGEKYIFEKAIQDINRWMELKHQVLTKTEIKQLKLVYDGK